MLYRSISVAIIFLLSWFAYNSMQSSRQISLQISNLGRAVAENSTLSLAGQEVVTEDIESIKNYITRQKQLNAAKKQLESKLSKQKKLMSFQTTYNTVLRAELLRFQKNYKEAAKLIKSTKKGIWQAGDTYTDKQKTLRGLMPKIDALVIAWSKGDGKATAKPVYSVLKQIIQEKGK